MRQQLRNRDRPFAVRRKLRPVLRDRIRVRKLAAIDEQRNGKRRDPLRRRPHIDQRIARPSPRARAVAIPAPQIDDAPPAAINRKRCADILIRIASRKIRSKGVAHMLEPWRDGAFDGKGRRIHLAQRRTRHAYLRRKPRVKSSVVSSASCHGERRSSG